MGEAIRASALVLLLACSAKAGHMQYDVTGAPPPPPPSTTQAEQTAAGHMQTDVSESFTETLLSVLESLRALF